MQQRIWVVLLMVASVLGVSAMTWWAWPYMTNISGTSTKNTAATNSATWKTYSDPTSRFTVEYPKAWKATACDESGVYFSAQSTDPCGLGNESISITEGELDGTLAETVDAGKLLYKGTTSTLTIDGVSATRLKGVMPIELSLDETPKEEVVDITYLEKGKKLWTITNAYPNQEVGVQKIFASLKFTSSTSNTNISTTADWKTYTDSTNRYTIQYPPDWTLTLNSTGPSFSGQGVTGKQFSTPIVTIKSKKDLYPKDSCLKGQTTVKVKGVDRTQQVEGCSYAGAEVATFFPYQDTHLVVSWTQDVSSAYDTYTLILSTFTFTNRGVTETSDWKTYSNKTYNYSFQHPKTLTLSAASPEYLTGIYVPSGDYRGYEEGLQELSVTVFDHRHGQSLIIGQYDKILEPHTLTIAGRDARWGITEVINESSGAKVVISQLQFFGKEQDLVLRLTEDGTLTPIIAEQLFKSLVVADTPSTTASYSLSCDGTPFTTNTTLTKASWWKKFSSQIITGWTLDQACYNSALNQVVYEKSRTDSTGNGGALIGVYSIATDTFVKATPRRAIYGGECAGDITWNIASGIITYRCGSGDAGAYWYGVYTFNPVTQVNTKIKECSGDAETNKEICS